MISLIQNFLNHLWRNRKKDERPWGRFEVLAKEPGSQMKRIEIFSGKRFSLQKHARRAEKWTVMSGQGLATLGSRQFQVQAGSVIEVPKGEIHRMENNGDGPLVIIEVQFGDYLGEDDIVRYEDDFGRV